MKVLIAADMEGISGVVHWDQVSPNHPEYARFRSLMTADVNAAIRGAFLGGASEVVVSDGHSNGRNILIEEMDPRARLNSGSPSPFSMVQGIDHNVQGLIFIGYHARVGTQSAILEHTWSSESIANLWINGDPFGEIGLNAAVAGHFNVPLIMISGDQAACSEAQNLVNGLEAVVVKYASSRMAAECLSPQEAQHDIEAGAQQAVSSLLRNAAPQPLRIPPPMTMVVEMVRSEMADRASLLPGIKREGRRVAYSAGNMPSIYTAFRAIASLARG